MHNCYRQRPLSIDTTSQKYIEEDENHVLDENILDHSALDSGLEMSPPMASSRRHSYTMSSAIFSPKSEEWQHVEMQHSASANPFVDQSGSAFIPQHQMFPQTGQSWLTTTSGSCTPMLQYDGLPGEYENHTGLFRGHMQVTVPFGNVGSQALFSPTSTANESSPTSPQKEWMGDSIESRSMPKRMRQNSPGLRSHSPFMRRDGIRKKNARFDIPAERNLLNIDHLIAQTTDEQEIKELKQQKRLLRNRQAAYALPSWFSLLLWFNHPLTFRYRLDSRQRKKQHTERLEDEKKQYTEHINLLEDQLEQAEADRNADRNEWITRANQYEQHIRNLELEKEEMVREHTLTTGDLRKKIAVLTDLVQKMESTAMSAVPSSDGFTAGYSDVDALTMNGAWDSISFLNDFPAEDEIKQEVPVELSKRTDVVAIEQEKPAAQGLLFMLLLFGAFVASKGSSPALPKVSDDMQAASATLLEDIFSDAGVLQSSGGMSTAVSDAMAPLQSGDAWFGVPTVALQNQNMMRPTPSALSDFADALSQPTEEQKYEQLFSLTAAQYNSLASHDFRQDTPLPPASQPRRNLAETLAAMRRNSKQSAAEVYTRSLLWEQIPTDVVRDFAKMVSDSTAMNRHDNDQTPMG